MAKLSQSFVAKKRHVLKQLNVPSEEYDDLSPKGSIDEGIRDLIDEINTLSGYVTTSSCAGRISVFLEGRKSTITLEGQAAAGDESRNDGGEFKTTIARAGGKGGGGKWLFVSHDAVDAVNTNWTETCGMQNTDLNGNTPKGFQTAEAVDTRLIHFKFEPMILHVLTASLDHAQAVLSAALQAGFRESGALNLVSSSTEPPSPMVGIRCMGLALESVIGFESESELISLVPEWQLKTLMSISNQRFVENTKRIGRFRAMLKEMDGNLGDNTRKGNDGQPWEDVQARRERKRAEGLEKAQQAKDQKSRQRDGHDILHQASSFDIN